MIVKWNETFSDSKDLPGGGAQGTILGPLEYFSQSSSSADSVPITDRFKFVDDLSIIEIVQLISKVVSYNFKHHIASDIGEHGNFIPGNSLKVQSYSNDIQNWTVNQKMVLNETKTKYMVFNFTDNYQFNTRIYVNNTQLECVNSTTLLGVKIQDDLRWESNTNAIIKKAYSSMRIITNLIKFNVSTRDLIIIYIIYVRSVLEYCCTVWHNSLTIEQSTDIERVQKVAIRTILNNFEIEYEDALEYFN